MATYTTPSGLIVNDAGAIVTPTQNQTLSSANLAPVPTMTIAPTPVVPVPALPLLVVALQGTSLQFVTDTAQSSECPKCRLDPPSSMVTQSACWR